VADFKSELAADIISESVADLRRNQHELVGDLFRERRIKAPTNVDCRQFLLLALVVWSEFRALTREVGLFGVCL
jgi:hypothetical protein